MLDTLVHRWLRLPYILHVHQFKKSKTKPRAHLLFIHGIGSSGEGWSQVIDQLPGDYSIMAIDLLGFGGSPQPEWAKYDVSLQARSIIATLMRLRVTNRVIVVGHSLGSLVAIEVAKRYPIIVKALILCSPPLYDANNDKNRLLRGVFKVASNRPDDFVRLTAIASKYKLINQSFNVTEDNLHSYLATLRASILTQTSLEDVKQLNLPILMIAGTADPWVKKRNLKAVAASNPRAELIMVLAQHEIRGRYSRVVKDAILRLASC